MIIYTQSPAGTVRKKVGNLLKKWAQVGLPIYEMKVLIIICSIVLVSWNGRSVPAEKEMKSHTSHLPVYTRTFMALFCVKTNKICVEQRTYTLMLMGLHYVCMMMY